MAILLLAACAGFTFPESHFSIDKTFVKAPSPQTEISSFLCDDVEDSNDFSTGVQLFHNASTVEFAFSPESTSPSKSVTNFTPVTTRRVYLLHRQFLI